MRGLFAPPVPSVCALLNPLRVCVYRLRASQCLRVYSSFPQMSHFSLPPIIDHSGWGPVPAALVLSTAATAAAGGAAGISAYQPVPAGAFQFAELPFQPFNKNDKLWRVSDWASKNDGRHTRRGNGSAASPACNWCPPRSARCPRLCCCSSLLVTVRLSVCLSVCTL